MHHVDGHFWGMHFLWWIVLLIVLIGIFRFLYKTSFRGPKKVDSLQILKKRFANGDISKEVYEESKKILEVDL
ncbi:SHOCT domain-containing protein [Arenibacter sp. TNZ]|nr:SHOCT domain-containing protein [Arenibacter sp. TNZ]